MMRALIFFVLFLICSCGGGIPGDVLPPEKMQAVFADYIKADVYTSEFLRMDSSFRPIEENLKLQNQLFAKHHITREEFYRSYEYYITHNDKMKALLDTITTRQQRAQTERYKKQYGADSAKNAAIDSSKKVLMDTTKKTSSGSVAIPSVPLHLLPDTLGPRGPGFGLKDRLKKRRDLRLKRIRFNQRIQPL